jgi:hypothetical protein
MKAGEPSVLPILATPLGRVLLDDAGAVNAALVAHLGLRRTQDGARSPSPLVYRTADDLFERTEAPVREFASEMLRGALRFIASINSLNDAQFRALKVESLGWLTPVSQHGCIPAANYPLSAWFVLYCIEAPAPSIERSDSGSLRFYQAGFGTMLQDATNAQLRMPFVTGHFTWRPTAGEMVIFPASTLHEVALLHGPGTLNLACARLRFVAPGQDGLARW